MKRHFCILFILHCIQCSSFGQNNHLIDSVFNIFKVQKDDTNKVNKLNQLTFDYGLNDPVTACSFGNKALEIANRIGYTLGLADAYLQISNVKMKLGDSKEALNNGKKALIIYEKLLKSGKSEAENYILKKKADAYSCLGVIHWKTQGYSEALNNHFAALKIRRVIKDKQGVSLSLNNIGNIYAEQYKYPEALKYYLAALSIQEELKDKGNIASSYVNIGVIYAEQNNYAEAIKNIQGALKIFREIGDKAGIATSLSNIGALYNAQGNYPEALNYDTLALKIQTELGDRYGRATTLENIGIIYSNLGQQQEALKNFISSLKSKEEINDKQGVATSYNNIGNIYMLLNNAGKAYQYFEKGLSYAKEINNIEIIQYLYQSLAELDSIQGNFKQAFEHYKLFIIYRDSLFNEENTKKLVQQQMQYDFDKKTAITNLEQEKREVVNQQQLQRQKIVRNFFIAGSILLLMLIFVIINRNQLKRTIEMERMRSRLSRDLHDDIGSTLSSINILSHTAQTHLDSTIDEKTKLTLEKINERCQRLLDSMGDIIWNINPGNDTMEEVMSRMREYASTLLEAKHIDYTFNFPDDAMECKLSMEVKKNMYLIFKEAINNLSKYSNCTKAFLSLTINEKNINLKIEDNGRGFKEDEIVHRGGLRNMQHRAEEIGGVFKIESTINEGTKIELTMPRYC